MEYKIIVMKATAGFLGLAVDDAVEKFAAEIAQQIALGWEPQGGVAIGGQPGARLFQAMVKRR